MKRQENRNVLAERDEILKISRIIPSRATGSIAERKPAFASISAAWRSVYVARGRTRIYNPLPPQWWCYSARHQVYIPEFRGILTVFPSKKEFRLYIAASRSGRCKFIRCKDIKYYTAVVILPIKSENVDSFNGEIERPRESRTLPCSYL